MTDPGLLSNGVAVVVHSVGLLVQHEAVIDEATLGHNPREIVIAQAFYPAPLTVTSKFGIYFHPAMAGAGDSWGRYILLSQVQPLCSTVTLIL